MQFQTRVMFVANSDEVYFAFQFALCGDTIGFNSICHLAES